MPVRKTLILALFFPSLLQGWYIVTYALGIYHLNLFIAFLSPKVDPSLMEDSGMMSSSFCDHFEPGVKLPDLFCLLLQGKDVQLQCAIFRLVKTLYNSIPGVAIKLVACKRSLQLGTRSCYKACGLVCCFFFLST